jgi:hypothetical protein
MAFSERNLAWKVTLAGATAKSLRAGLAALSVSRENMVGGCPKSKYGSAESQKALRMIETSTSDL